jgi:class 3 adenylate cyclase
MSTEEHEKRILSRPMERKLTAILSADVKGYSRLMGEDDTATVRTLTAHRTLMTSLIQHRKGRVVDSPGDNLLAEFASVVDAVQCAVEIQREFKVRNAEVPEQRRMEFRIGINLGDVIVEGERLYGDRVNIAARLESLADAGGICISGTVLEHVGNKLPLRYEDLGEQTVKNIAKPVRIYRVHWDESSSHQVASPKSETADSHTSQVASPKSRWVGITGRAWMVVAGLVLIVGAIVTVRYLAVPKLSPQSSVLKPRQRCCRYPTSLPSSSCPSST